MRPSSPRPLAVSMVAALVLGVTGCGDDDTDTADSTTTLDETTITSDRSTTTDDSTTTSVVDPDDDAGPDMVGEAGTDTVETPGFPQLTGPTALLVDIRASGHDGFDRVVLEFAPGDAPEHRVGYVDPPVRADGSGHEVEIAGDAFLEIRVVPAASYDPRSDDARPTYAGPDELTPPGAAVVREIEKIADFEGHLAWVLGIDGGEAPFAVTVLQDPLRLVVDVVAE